MRLFILLLFLPAFTLFAQLPASQYIDMVHLYEGAPKAGTVLTYEYGKRVVLVEERTGLTMDFAWDEVKRVNFRLDRSREEEVVKETIASRPVLSEASLFPEEPFQPKRKFKHQVTAGASFGRGPAVDFPPFRSTTLAGGIAYHLVRDFNLVSVGVGIDLSLMNHRLQEKVLALTSQVDLPLSRGPVQPFIRMEAGVTYPFGAGDGEAGDSRVTERSIAPLVHPAIGLEFVGKKAQWQRLTIDLGYRFFTSTFTITDANLDVIERKANYRRLILRGGMRF